jgi:ABC-type nitrate/sulfonate/bicarbonate transport system permease component
VSTVERRRTWRPGAPDSRWIPPIAVAIALVSWEVSARLGLLPGYLFSSPTTVLATLGRSIASGEMLEHVLATVARVIPGLLLGGIPGLALGIGMGLSSRLRQALDPMLAAIHPIPKIAILPLVMIFLGVGEASRIAVASLAAFFPMLINTMAGIRQIDPIYFQVAENYGAGRLKVLTCVVLPGSLPFVLSGLRLAANLTLLVTLSAEIVMADVGLGSLVWLAWETLRVELLYATLIMISILGISLTASLRYLQRALAPWQLTEPTR